MLVPVPTTGSLRRRNTAAAVILVSIVALLSPCSPRGCPEKTHPPEFPPISAPEVR